MTEPIVSWAVGFLTGGFFGFRSGWLWGRGGAVRRTPFIFNEGHTTRSNNEPGPTTPKPNIIPRGTRSITFPDPEPGRQPTNPFTGKPVKPQFPSPRVIPGDTP